MHEAHFQLEVITPVFMRGANQNKAEIRAASIKGLMRWWFRALAGSYFGNDVEGLRRAEAEVFGTAGEAGSKKSCIRLFVDETESFKAFKTENLFEQYFWFSQIGKYSKPAIFPGTKVKVMIESHSEWAMEISLMALWFALHLGGFGSRSRKFAGSLFPVEEPETDIKLNYKFIPEKNNLTEYYSKTIKSILKRTKGFLESRFKQGPLSPDIKYPAISNSTSNVFIGETYTSPSDAIESVGKWYLGVPKARKFHGGFRFLYADRKIPHRMYEKFKRYEVIKNVSASSERRPYLGLPIQFYKKFNGEYIRFSIDHWDANRRASGLFMTLNKVKDSQYYPVITVFKYRFLPQFTGPVRYSGGVYKSQDRKKLASVEGALFILEKGENPNLAYSKFLEDLVFSLKSNFTEVFP